jgi:putative ABC transport system permease protein
MLTMIRRLWYAIRTGRRQAELREEIETHRSLRQAALERSGMTADRAAPASRRALGNATLAAEDVRDVWVIRGLDTTWQDLRAALRGLRKSPGFTLVAVGTLALGIGANTALFSIFNSLILRPLPVRDPGSLALLTGGSWTYPIWEEVRRAAPELFGGAFAWGNERFDLAQGGETAPVDGAYVSGEMFQVLGLPAALGRTVLPADDRAGADALVAVISHRFWQQHFAGAPDVVGRQLTLERVPFTVVGVLPAGFRGPDVGQTTDVMIPFAAKPQVRGSDSALRARSNWWLEIMVRLAPGQRIEQAEAALRGAQPAIRAATMPDWPQAMQQRYLDGLFTLAPASTGRSTLRGRFETPLLAMVVAVGLVLLVACANIASLLLARAVTRRRELSVRLALGASRWRLGRLLFTESLLVAIIGAAAGLLFARWSSVLVVQQLSTWRSAVTLDLGVDWRVLGFTAALACVSALVSGVAPVFGIKRVAPNDALKEAGRGVAAERRFSTRGALVIVQIALSLMLVVAAGLFLRTFAALSRAPLGFVAQPLIVVNVNLQSAAVEPEARAALVDRLRESVAQVPGVQSAAVSRVTPVSGSGWNNWVGDSPAPPRDRGLMTWLNAVTPGWFDTMGIPLRAGRDFDAADRTATTSVAVINESFARRFLPGRPPVGQTITLGGGDRYEVVGVVADAVYRSPREGMTPTVYLPMPRTGSWTEMALIVAADRRRAEVERDVGAALTRVEPSVAFTYRTFDELLDATVTQERLVAMLSAFFGGLALLIAAVGLYGIVSHDVRSRQTEIGLRMALGAEPSGIVRLVFARVGVLVAAGLAIGLAGGLWAAGFVDALLFKLEARDPITFGASVAVLVAVGALAAWLPARRAARLDPATVLREG